jgi:ubiquinone/menaquinone biosynthesis C-methylase UbiE
MKKEYMNLQYHGKDRWVSYWYQIDETLSKNPDNILIIGKGSGIVEYSIALISPQTRITTFDIDIELNPDVVGDVRYLPFEDGSFDCILCCQVLEHLPYSEIDGVLREIYRVVRNSVILSIPQRRKYIKVEFAATHLGTKRLIIKYPFNKKKISNSQHCWELNRGVSCKDFQKLLMKYFSIEKSFLNEIICKIRFFILDKKPV